MKTQILEQIIKHLQKLQGQDLHGLMEERKKPVLPKEESDDAAKLGGEQPYDDKVDAAVIDVVKKPEVDAELVEDEEEMTDDELRALLDKCLA